MSTQGNEVLHDLAQAGFEVNSVSELFGLKFNYKAAVPVLLKWLPLVTDQKLKEEIVRALSVKWARPMAAAALAEQFRLVSDQSGMGIRWAIANALAVVADDSVLNEIVSLVKAREYGRSREMLAVALGNMKDDRVDEVLIDLLDDEEISGHVLMAVRKRRIRRAKDKIEKLTSHPKAWIRKEAEKALKAIT